MDSSLSQFWARRPFSALGAAFAAFFVCVTASSADEEASHGSDWDKRIARIAPLSKDTEVGQYATFGTFEQDGAGEDGREPIVWLVANKSESKVLLVSRYVLDILPFIENSADADWEHSTVRSWLSNYFLNNSFSKQDKEMIVLSEIANLGYGSSGIQNKSSTSDYVFLLSVEEAKTYLKGDDFMKSAPTPVAASDSGFDGSICGIECDTSEGLKAMPWWTRTMGSWVKSCVAVESDGSINMKGYAGITEDEIGIRPAVWVRID